MKPPNTKKAQLTISMLLGATLLLSFTSTDFRINYHHHNTAPCNISDPFELLYFDVIRNGFEVVIIWDAINELQLVGYQIERAIGNSDFEKVGWEYSREITREMFYEFTDTDVSPSQETYFYRLKMVDYAGNITYSPVTRALRIVQ